MSLNDSIIVEWRYLNSFSFITASSSYFAKILSRIRSGDRREGVVALHTDMIE